jgi:Ca2+-binding RTX toxin-like protein
MNRRNTPLLVGTLLVAGALTGPVFGAAAINAGATGSRTPTCFGVPATVVGTPGSDELAGTDGVDVVVALGGDDTVRTGPGRDLVCLGGGFDLASLEAGADRAAGGAGDDTLNGGKGADVLAGRRDVDALFGGPGRDRLRGGPGTGIVVEGLIGGGGDDVLIGGPGLDTAHYFDAPGAVEVNLRRGRAVGHGSDVLIGIDGAVGSNFSDLLIGNAAGNGLFGQAGDDIIRAGGSGRLARGTADVLSGDQGDDMLGGGAGQDLVTYGRILGAVTVNLAAGVATGHGDDRLLGAEALQGSRFGDTLIGGSTADLIIGNLGDDVIDGAGGRDTVIYRDVIGPVEVRLASGTGRGEAAGEDTLSSMESIWGTNAADDLQGTGGRNIIVGFGGDDRLVGFDGVDVLDGREGTDTCEDVPAEVVNCERSGSTRTGEPAPDAGWSRWLAVRPAGAAAP